MQLSELRTRVRYHLREATANTWADAELTSHINLAQKYIGSRLNPELVPALVLLKTETVTTAASSWDLPTDYIRMASDPWFIGTGSVYNKCPFVNPKKFGELSAHDPTNIFYQKYASTVINNDLYLTQTVASGILGYLYMSYPADLSSDSDVSEIPEGYIDLVILKAAADALIKTRQLQESTLIMKEIEGRLQLANGGKR